VLLLIAHVLPLTAHVLPLTAHCSRLIAHVLASLLAGATQKYCGIAHHDS
jgi:hypothetical protein